MQTAIRHKMTVPLSADDRFLVFVDVVDEHWTDAIADVVVVTEFCAQAAFSAAEEAASSNEFQSLVPSPGSDRICEASIVLTDDDQVAALNVDYRDKAGPTNVLSFPGSGGPMPGDADMPILLGDVVIAFGVAQSEADAASVPLVHHLSHLVVHGMLHLMGWDHEGEDEAVHMEALETLILNAMQIPDPYQRP